MVTLQPLKSLHDARSGITDLKYSPGAGQMLAAASHDLCIDIYRCWKKF